VKWAAQHHKQTEMKKAFFEAYFGMAENITEADVLVQCAEKIGLNGSDAREVLASDLYADDVRQDEKKYQQAGVSAVPAYIIDSKYLISGAQEPETLIKALREIAAEPA
jgi:predicted DsbA family dithiol-disulfide isomerase